MATVLEERTTRPALTAAPAPKLGVAVEWLAPWLVAALALGIAVSLFAYYAEHSREIWYGLDHDRTAHLEYGMNVAMDLRCGNIAGLLHHLDGARVWGPLHGIVSAPAHLLLGPNQRWGILPSWCAWIATVVLGFLIGRRLLPEGGTAAGLLAAMFIALSPAHRAFATDVMLESSGAALTLLCLWRYLILVQDEDNAKRGRWFALSLSALFFTKSNYWLIIVVGLCAGEFVRNPRLARDWALTAARAAFPWLGRQVRNPLNYLIAALVGVTIYIAITGGGVIQMGRTKISLTRGHNTIHLAYALAFVQVAVWWYRNGIGRQLADKLPLVRDIAYWHLWPVATYFLMPKRLGYFFWYISPANSDARPEGIVVLRGLEFYFEGIRVDYHVIPWVLFLVLAGIAIGAATLKHWRSGSVSIFCFLAVACLATCQHPMHKYRLAHTWVAVVWILGSAGLVYGVFLAMRSLPKLRVGAIAAACVALAVLHGPFWLQPGRAQESGVRPGALSILNITDTFLPSVRTRHPMLMSRVYSPFFLSWSFQEAARHQRFETVIDGLDLKQPDPAFLKAWSEKTACDSVVLIEIAETSPYFVVDVGNLNVAAVRQFLQQSDSGFVLSQTWTLPEQVEITLWTKK